MSNNVETKIAEEYITKQKIDTNIFRIKYEHDSCWESRYIPELVESCWRDLIRETWNFLKKYNNPKIDFSLLKHECIREVKRLKSELF